MSALPYPPEMRSVLAPGVRANRSLVMDRCFAAYGPDWQILKEDRKQGTPDGKLQFFTSFMAAFAQTDARGFDAFLERRRSALAALGTARACMRSTSRLVVGLGLPHPTETCLLLDRLTGCPYLPGSSVKGLLREAATLVLHGEIQLRDSAGCEYHEAMVRRVFGPAVGQPGYPACGEMVFYDSFPSAWPVLELDVLTPHYSDYYGDRTGKVVPGDWESPIPVRFLAVQAGTEFEFSLRGTSRDSAQRRLDEDAIRALLPVALDWLGIGAKKSSGYGVFEPAGARAAGTPAVPPARHTIEPAPRPRPTRPVGPPGAGRHPDQGHRDRTPPGPRVAFVAPARVTVHEHINKEVVTLDSLPEGTKAWVTTADGVRIRCRGVDTHRQPRVGDRLKAAVTRNDGVAVEAQFKGWL